MFFSGDPSTRRKVDLGGRSSKERDRKKILEQARLDRERRQRLRLETQSATNIQKAFRGRRLVALLRQDVRNQFCQVYGDYGEKAKSIDAFQVDSLYMPQLLFFYRLNDNDDLLRAVNACNLLLSCSDDLQQLLFGGRSPDNAPIIVNRVKKFSYLCLATLHHHRVALKEELLSSDGHSRAAILLNAILMLTDPKFSCSGSVMDFLFDKKLFLLLREMLQTVDLPKQDGMSCLEVATASLAVRLLEKEKEQGFAKTQKWSFPTQILSIPLLFKKFPFLKQVFVTKGLWESSICHLASLLPDITHYLPPNLSANCPSNICLLGNLLETSEAALGLPDCPRQLAFHFAAVTRSLMEGLPFHYIKSSEGTNEDFEDSMEEDKPASQMFLEKSIEDQIVQADKIRLLADVVRLALPDASLMANGTEFRAAPSDIETAAMSEVCAFLYAVFSLFPLELSGALCLLGFRTRLVYYLLHYVERYHSACEWSTAKLQGKNNFENHSTTDMDGLMLPLLILCIVYSYQLASIDAEEFYEQQKPLKLDDVRLLVVILKEALWQLLWVLPSKLSPGSATEQKDEPKSQTVATIFSRNYIRQKVNSVGSRLLGQLQDWNNRRQFIPPQNFYAREAMDEMFFSQVENENPRVRDLLAQAPFLVPFTHRVRIYTAQLAAARQHNSSQGPFTRLRVRIRRDRIVEDAFANLNPLQADALQGMIRVTFVNEFGAEEAGVDGGGIFKDFMESITKAAFDIQYGLFKETHDHLLYPNPASHMVHDDHLQYFEFLGKILGKAMFEGILVDIPFATFFLSKLKRKHNLLDDLQSLDPELYRSLLFLKHYEGDVTQLGLYFVIENNEYGEQVQIELLPGGKDITVDSENVIKYIHLVANHRLNAQIRSQSQAFLSGFQQLIDKKWIDMFNEHELQVLISGSVEGLNVDDLRLNVHYAGYTEDHPVIGMFWEIVKTFDSGLQQKFLKFVTGCSRGPLLGFKYLEPKFCIQRAAPEDVSDDMLDRLPTSATCMNLLKLPPYKRKDILREKLLYAINAEAGFDLS